MRKVLLASIVGTAAVASCAERKQAPSRDAPAVVVVEADAESPAATQEIEPNDGADAAQRVHLGAVRGVLEGADVDCFQFVGAEAGVLSVHVAGASAADFVLTSYGQRHADQPPTVVLVNNAGIGGGETLSNLDYRQHQAICLKTANAQGQPLKASYQLTAELRPRSEGEEREPNDSRESASELSLDAEAIGYLGWPDDEDWYAVGLGDHRRGRLSVELDPPGEFAATLGVYASDGVLRYQRQTHGHETCVVQNLIVGAKDELVYLKIKSSSRKADPDARYSLRTAFSDGVWHGEREGNDTVRAASTARIGTPFLGHLPDGYDRDYVRLPASQPGFVRVTADVPLGLDLLLAQVDGGSGTVLWEVNASRAGGAETLPVIFARPPAAALRLRSRRTRDSDPRQSYRLLVTSVLGDNWEIEPNDKVTAATPLGEGGRRGYLYPPGDVDYLDLSKGRPEATNLRLIGPLGVVVELRDAQDRQLLRQEKSADQPLILPLRKVSSTVAVVKLTAAAGEASATDAYTISWDTH